VPQIAKPDYLIRVHDHIGAIPRERWDALLALQDRPTPFMRHAYLQALQDSGSACEATGWALRVISLWDDESLVGACPLYLKTHSRGEYVFDWAWAEAYERHGLSYYPKAVVASPFTPVPGSKLLAINHLVRCELLSRIVAWCNRQGLPSLHILFADEADLAVCQQLGLQRREQVQFHWRNQGWRDFDDFLGSLSQDKRKKIRQERRKVRDAGVRFRAIHGAGITPADWELVERCYRQTYREHGNPPYLQPGFFDGMRQDMAAHWLVFVAQMEERPIGMSLIGLQHDCLERPQVAYGRYWGALSRVDCLHFEACYYQPIEWCIEHGVQRFEGGAQGEHKIARALLPAATASAHWLAHPEFAQAVGRFLQRERQGIEGYREALESHNPLKQT
jgi:predicted N-acyltransferase